MKMLEIGLGVILLGILLFIMGGIIEINALSREIADVADANMFASWLKGFSQILLFAGIGFILYDIADKSK